MSGTPGPSNISTKLQRIAELARGTPQMVFTTLAHHIDVEFLREAHSRTRKDGAVGVDGVTAEEYAKDLDKHLTGLLDRFKSGSYRAPPVKRVFIPKGDGKSLRPLGIPAFEDKVLQRAVTMVLEQIYEEDFLPCSYGFRRGKSAHDALAEVRQRAKKVGGGWIIDLDIEKFFDTIDHDHLRKFLDQRVRDGVIRRTIGKWLNAGVLDGKELEYPLRGTPQGGVISPLLANIYLHEVLDKWFEQDVKPRLNGPGHLVRYADDAVIIVAEQTDAERIMAVLPKRMSRLGLTIHPTKTRVVDFHDPYRSDGDAGRPGTFNFLGFTFHWGRNREGHWSIKTKTAKDRFKRSLKRVAEWCKANRHSPVDEQHVALRSKVRGHQQYYGVPGNLQATHKFAFWVTRIWHKWLNRRSQRRNMPWERFQLLLQRYPLHIARYATAAKP